MIARLASRYVDPDASLRPAPDPNPPFHTMVVGAHLIDDGALSRWRQAALDVFETYAGDAPLFLEALGIEGVRDPVALRAQVARRLSEAPLEDLRVDFEDGYGERPDEEEDRDAKRTGALIGRAVASGEAPRSIGLRIEPLDPTGAVRALTTLTLYWDALLDAAGRAPERMVVTLPKVTVVEQVVAACEALEQTEQRLGLAAGALRLEFMMESVHTLFDAEGRLALPALIRAAAGRCSGVHLGTFDYTAAHHVPAHHQQLMHPACEFARQLMRISVGAHGPRLCDGSTHVLPIAEGAMPRERIHAAWELHARHVLHAFGLGIEQGWDLHPHQWPARWAALIAACSEALPRDLERLAGLLASRDGTAMSGGVQDDVVTGQAVLDDLRRAVAVGALDVARLSECGLGADELVGRPLAEILRRRRA